jgi:hypothetical protein
LSSSLSHNNDRHGDPLLVSFADSMASMDMGTTISGGKVIAAMVMLRALTPNSSADVSLAQGGVHFCDCPFARKLLVRLGRSSSALIVGPSAAFGCSA